MSTVAGEIMGSDTQIKNFPAATPSRIERKVIRSLRPLEAVEYDDTHDVGYLHQYFRLREEMFINLWGLKNFSAQRDTFDDEGTVIVARRGNLVLGGARLNIGHYGTDKHIPLEKTGLDLQALFPEIDLESAPYCEVSRLAILPEFQNSEILEQLCVRFGYESLDLGVRYAFTMAPLPLARRYRQALLPHGLHWKIRNDIIIPDREEFEGIKMVLSICDLASFRQFIQKESAGVKKQPQVELAN